jgi:hypothetical protein
VAADAGKGARKSFAACRARSYFHGNGVNHMLDLFYVGVGCITLFLFWMFTKACDKL